jgi:hypothetical protein
MAKGPATMEVLRRIDAGQCGLSATGVVEKINLGLSWLLSEE